MAAQTRTRGEQQFQAETQIFIELRRKLNPAGGEAGKKFETKRKHDEITEQCSRSEEDGRNHGHGNHPFTLMGIKSRRDESPNLGKNVRADKKQPGHNGYFDM